MKATDAGQSRNSDPGSPPPAFLASSPWPAPPLTVASTVRPGIERMITVGICLWLLGALVLMGLGIW